MISCIGSIVVLELGALRADVTLANLHDENQSARLGVQVP
jgi:hypothetical protein